MEKSAEGLRIRLDLSDFVTDYTKFRWIFLPLDSFCTISDLIDHIRNEYSACESDDIITLFLQEPFCLPSWESIQVLKDTDIVKVKVSKSRRKRKRAKEPVDKSELVSVQKKKRPKQVPAPEIPKAPTPVPTTSSESSSDSNSEENQSNGLKSEKRNAITTVDFANKVIQRQPSITTKEGLANPVKAKPSVKPPSSSSSDSSSGEESESDIIPAPTNPQPKVLAPPENQIDANGSSVKKKRKRKRKRKPRNRSSTNASATIATPTSKDGLDLSTEYDDGPLHSAKKRQILAKAFLHPAQKKDLGASYLSSVATSSIQGEDVGIVKPLDCPSSRVVPSLGDSSTKRQTYTSSAPLISCEDILLGGPDVPRKENVGVSSSANGISKKTNPVKNDFSKLLALAKQSTPVVAKRQSSAHGTDSINNQDLSSLPVLTSIPNPGSRIAFRVLEIQPDYSPGLSEMKTAKVIGKEPGNKVILDIELQDDSPLHRRTGGKFEIDDETVPMQDSGTVSYVWSDLSRPVLICSENK